MYAYKNTATCNCNTQYKHKCMYNYMNYRSTEYVTRVADGAAVKPVDVVITGLNIILPLMNEETLKVS